MNIYKNKPISYDGKCRINEEIQLYASNILTPLYYFPSNSLLLIILKTPKHCLISASRNGMYFVVGVGTDRSFVLAPISQALTTIPEEESLGTLAIIILRQISIH